MICIVEGIDRVGKSTLAKKLEQELNIKSFRGNDTDFFKLSQLDNVNETDKFLKIIKLCKMLNSDIIFDRFYWSDFVYGCLERCYDFTKALEHFDMIENALTELNAVVIYIKPTDIKMSSEQHGKNLERYEKLYDFIFSVSKINKLKCNYNSLQEAVSFCKNRLLEERRRIINE